MTQKQKAVMTPPVDSDFSALYSVTEIFDTKRQMPVV